LDYWCRSNEYGNFFSTKQLEEAMILTREQAEEREKSEDNAINIIHKITGKGQHRSAARTEGSTNRTTAERAMIGLTAKFDTIENTANMFGVSKSSVTAYKKGVTTHNKETASEISNQELRVSITEKSDKIAESAVDKLMGALNLIQPELLEKRPVREIASVAVSLANVFDKVRPQTDKPAAAQVIIFAPGQRNLEEYNVVEVETK
jgi:transcriptional regulator with XRE-family HTH domain